ncbi:hypothetical protein IKF27_03480 [Candidatus Saccharibacteria bacterium]|nr:hypothetical protein [Candidatus Saccharibacteria bacterium]
MVEMEDLVKNNGEIRGLFIDFLGSDKFNQIISAMQEQKLQIAEMDPSGYRVIIDLTNQVDNKDAEELEAAKRKKYVRISVAIKGNSTVAVSAHRIKNPDWWVLPEPPNNASYLLASCWVYDRDFSWYLERFKNTVQDILENLDPRLLHDYEAIPFPA